MERLDKTLNALYTQLNRTFSLKTMALIANQLMVSLKELHAHGYLHRDIKPENIMTAEHSHAVKLIDFGLAEREFCKKSVALIGNVRFCSRRAHFGFSGKKEDL
jgi:serine/threonine protein kinase